MKETISINIKTICVIVFSLSFLVTYLIMPAIIDLLKLKNLFDKPNLRSSHTRVTPSMGGIAFFFTLMISFFFLEKWDVNNVSTHIIPGITILFFVGMKDDLIVLRPSTKLIGQIISALFCISHPAIIIKSLDGFWGIYEISNLLAYPIGIFFMIAIINAFNLIDGVDGLASIIGQVITLVYAIIFYYLGDYFFSLLSLVLMGSLLAFLRYNLSLNNKRKIFMGDTGSLIIGFIISVLTIHFLASASSKHSEIPFLSKNAPYLVLAVLIVPLFDAFRVFTIRIIHKKNPFHPDKNHIHHILTNLGFSHKKIALFVGVFNFFFIIIFAVISGILNDLWITISFTSTILLLIYIFYILDFSFSNLRTRVRLRRKIRKIRNK